MSICPTPPLKRKTDYTTVGSISLTAPQPKYEFCEGGTTSVLTSPGSVVTSTICCPSPGPMGPAGPAGQLMLKYDGVELGNITSLDVKGTGLLPEIIGTDGFLSTTCMKWIGDWAVGVAYKQYDVVRNASDGNGYVCQADHTSSAPDEPLGDGGFYWQPITDVNKAQMAPADKTFLDSLRDDVLDWMKNATVGDWITALAVGAGIIYAGSKILDAVLGTPSSAGSAGTRYDGSPGYNGAFTAPTLPVVVASLLEYAGYTSSQYDVSLLPPSEVNFTLGATVSIRNVLNSLALVYQFDIVPSGGVIKFVPKYQSSARTLTLDDLGHQDNNNGRIVGTAPYTAKRMQGIDLPRSVTLTYDSADLYYNRFVQVATLDTYPAGQDVRIDVPLTLLDADAFKVAQTSLINAHIEQQQFTFITDYHNIDLEPGDVVDLPLDDGTSTMRVRIVQISENTDGLLEFTVSAAIANDVTYTIGSATNAIANDQTSGQPLPATLTNSQTLFLEVPPLSDSDTTPRLKAIVHGYGATGWQGAVLYESVDGGVTYNPVYTSYSMPTFGLVASTLAAPTDYHVWDTTTTISVQLRQGTLANSTDIAVQNGANWCMIGEEVIGFVNATLTGPNTYTLSRLLRGRAGSEVKCATHVANELFVLLDDTLLNIPLTKADIGKTVKYKTVTTGGDLSLVTADDVTPFALNMRMWAVAQLQAVRQPNDDWVFTWVERPRYNNQLTDYVEITHDPDWAGFGVAILSGSVVKYTATTVSPTYTYTAAQQVIDFGAVQPSITVSVTQLSTDYGGGYPSVLTA